MRQQTVPRFGRPWLEGLANGLTVLIVVSTLCWDALSVLFAYWMAYEVRASSPNTLYGPEFYWALAQFSVISTLLVFAASGLYRAPGYQSRFDEVAKALIGLVLAFAIVVAGVFFFREASFSRFVLLYAWAVAAVSIVAGRLALQQINRSLRGRGFGLQPVLIVGTGAPAESLKALLATNPQWGLHLVGLVTEEVEEATEHRDVIASVATLGRYLATHEVAEVWVALPDYPRRQLLELLQVITAVRPVQIRLLPGILEYVTARMQVDVLGGTALLTLQDTPLRRASNRFAKRFLDIVLSGFGLVLGAPLFVLIAAAVKCSSPGPVFYQQERIGRDGAVFWIYKFRTMREGAEGQQPGWTTRDDPRRTPVGAFLRRTSLDELPQLWNVLVGEMSLVGPRPERPIYVERFSQDIPKYLDRHLVKTGITGWAQIHGLRGDTSIPDRVRYDLYYIENWSLLLDLRIILVTALQVLFHPEDAY
ncbi:undecaprenyl-phosphate glucose phosphotransferase [Gloeobacter morelensis]|uniref:Undecaprenyl-phosphate glucose phosphotransferase n=1 Tax=Gloeobacter morelensis MG652769 TaxID=2781736 RepID=A0ABY3PQI2_9CYAN|nr:undecaprenyl-phosphate glucose phosphotransferase [Gloeobacter morelensis]UFP95968.1 undecaprenyl-phosphate glucose phosphotransferase [Gloeobacter morelensis MG652769]